MGANASQNPSDVTEDISQTINGLGENNLKSSNQLGDVDQITEKKLKIDDEEDDPYQNEKNLKNDDEEDNDPYQNEKNLKIDDEEDDPYQNEKNLKLDEDIEENPYHNEKLVKFDNISESCTDNLQRSSNHLQQISSPSAVQRSSNHLQQISSPSAVQISSKQLSSLNAPSALRRSSNHLSSTNAFQSTTNCLSSTNAFHSTANCLTSTSSPQSMNYLPTNSFHRSTGANLLSPDPLPSSLQRNNSQLPPDPATSSIRRSSQHLSGTLLPNSLRKSSNHLPQEPSLAAVEINSGILRSSNTLAGNTLENENVATNEKDNISTIPLTFHEIHGKHVALSGDKTVATRLKSFCYGIAFSSRPIEIDEIVRIQLIKVEASWNGVMRFGLTSFNPTAFDPESLPRFANPQFIYPHGFWTKSLPAADTVQDNILSFYLTDNGWLHLWINNDYRGKFIGTIPTNVPLWVMTDVYGNVSSLKILHDTCDLPVPSRKSIGNMAASNVYNNQSGNFTSKIPIVKVSRNSSSILSPSHHEKIAKSLQRVSMQPQCQHSKLKRNSSVLAQSNNELTRDVNEPMEIEQDNPVTSRNSLMHQRDEDVAWRSGALPGSDHALPRSNAPLVGSRQSLTDPSNNVTNETVDGKLRECFICRTLSSNTAIYDCGHVCMCEECGKSLLATQAVPKCPICRSSIKDIIKLHHV